MKDKDIAVITTQIGMLQALVMASITVPLRNQPQGAATIRSVVDQARAILAKGDHSLPAAEDQTPLQQLLADGLQKAHADLDHLEAAMTALL